jgi:hypothetical protein
MEHDEDVAPAGAAIARHENAAIGDGMDGVAQVAILAADAVEIIAQVPILGERLRIVGEGAVLTAEWKIESRRGRERGQEKWWWKLEGRIDLRLPGKFGPESQPKARTEREQEETGKQHCPTQ